MDIPIHQPPSTVRETVASRVLRSCSMYMGCLSRNRMAVYNSKYKLHNRGIGV